MILMKYGMKVNIKNMNYVKDKIAEVKVYLNTFSFLIARKAIIITIPNFDKAIFKEVMEMDK